MSKTIGLDRVQIESIAKAMFYLAKKKPKKYRTTFHDGGLSLLQHSPWKTLCGWISIGTVSTSYNHYRVGG